MFRDLAVALENGSETERNLGQLVFSFINIMTNACVDELLVKWREENGTAFCLSTEENSLTLIVLNVIFTSG